MKIPGKQLQLSAVGSSSSSSSSSNIGGTSGEVVSAGVASHDALVVDEGALGALVSPAFQVSSARSTLATLVAHVANADGARVDESATGASPIPHTAPADPAAASVRRR